MIPLESEDKYFFSAPPDALFSAVKNFTEVADSFHEKLQQIDTNK